MGLACFKPPNLVDVRFHRCRTLNRLNPQPLQSTLGFWKAVDLEASAWRFLFWDYHLKGLFSKPNSRGRRYDVEGSSGDFEVIIDVTRLFGPLDDSQTTGLTVGSSGDGWYKGSLRLGEGIFANHKFSHEIFETAKFYCVHLSVHLSVPCFPKSFNTCPPKNRPDVVQAMDVASGIFNTPDLRTCSKHFCVLSLRPGRECACCHYFLLAHPYPTVGIWNHWDMGIFLGCEATWVHCFLWYIWKTSLAYFMEIAEIAIHQQHSCGISLTDIGYPWRSIGFVGWVWYLYLPLVYSTLFPWSKKNACLCFFFSESWLPFYIAV